MCVVNGQHIITLEIGESINVEQQPLLFANIRKEMLYTLYKNFLYFKVQVVKLTGFI